jgi:hypothetical protein
MKSNFTLLLLFIVNFTFAQNGEKIIIPKGIAYSYVENNINEKAKQLIIKSLSQNNNYELLQDNLMVGPSLWKNLQNIENLKSIPKNVIFHIDDIQVNGKMCQDIDDSKKVWNEVKKEVSENYQIRKANVDELKYYWSTISFDIEEPLFILETENHNYILNFLKKEMKLLWIDEFPIKKSYDNPIDNRTLITDGSFKSYQNGNEVYITSQGEKETKLEKVIFLSSDSELKANTSIEDIQTIIEKTNKIFEDLFKKSEKPGKIMIQFELGEKKNIIQFAVRDDLDLDIMKEFEKRVNEEKYPNSKKSTIKFQVIYKVNSLNDNE